MDNQLTPESFKQRVLSANPQFAKGVASDGTPYSSMDATDFTQRMVQKNPNGVTKDGHKYSDFLPQQKTDNTPAPDKSYLQEVGGELSNRIGGIGNAVSDTLTGKINPLSGILQSVGSVAGGINDIVGSSLEHLPGVGGVVKGAEGLIGAGVKNLARTDIGKKVIGGISNFAQQHPELSADIGAVGNIVGAAATLEGGSAVKDIVESGVSKALGKNAIESVISDVAPELTGKAGVKNVAKQGLMKTAITGEIKPIVDKATTELGQIVVDNVPKFTKLATFADKVNATREAVYSMADKLKTGVINSGKDIIYPFKELAAKMNGLEPSIAIKSDSILQNQFNLAKEAALKIAKEKGGTISSLFDARKAFDDLVAKQFPNLYDRLNTPMRDAITSMRRAMNDFIAEKLPAGSGFIDSLKIQSRLFDAIDNMAPKAFNEIGSTRFSRFAGNHPVISNLLKKGATGAAITAGGGALYGGYKTLTGD